MSTSSARRSLLPLSVPELLAALFCVAFGLSMVLNTQSVGDGLWFWYAVLLRNGKHLYSEMHLPLQPLFVLETAGAMRLLGTSWIATRIPAAVHVFLFVGGLCLLVRRAKLGPIGKAILLGAAFFVSISSPLYRFDDYHVLSDSFVVYSLVLLLALADTEDRLRANGISGLLGVLSGLAIVTRVNDGAALLVGVVIAILCLAKTRRLLNAAIELAMAFATVVVTVFATGDSLGAYVNTCILHAASSKGGTGHVLANPVLLPLHTLLWLDNSTYLGAILFGVAAGLVWTFLVGPVRSERRDLIGAGICALLLAASLLRVRGWFIDSVFLLSIAAIGVFVLYGAGVLAATRLVRSRANSADTNAWDARQILYLIPLGQQASMSMSSGGSHLGSSFPLALLVLLLAVTPLVRGGTLWKTTLLTIAVMLLGAGFIYKVRYPYLWHSYRCRPLFVGRQWYRHPEYGYMYIDREQLRFIEPICDAIHAGPDPRELLSLPYPFANYFCGLPPWHDYVQTFFDTSTPETIYGMMGELETQPPEWILYQRQLFSLGLHEQLYNQGRPLPQRHLDERIEQKISEGKWVPVIRSDYQNGSQWSNEWLLIRTR